MMKWSALTGRPSIIAISVSRLLRDEYYYIIRANVFFPLSPFVQSLPISFSQATQQDIVSLPNLPILDARHLTNGRFEPKMCGQLPTRRPKLLDLTRPSTPDTRALVMSGSRRLSLSAFVIGRVMHLVAEIIPGASSGTKNAQQVPITHEI